MKHLLTYLLLSITFITVAQQAARQGSYWLGQGDKQYDDGAYLSAEQSYQKAIKYFAATKDTNNALLCYTNLYSLKLIQERPQDFLPYEQDLLLLCRANVPMAGYVLFCMGQTYRNEGRFDEARKFYQQAAVKYRLLAQPNLRLLGNIYHGLGATDKDLGDQEEAVRYFRLAVQQYEADTTKDAEIPSDKANALGNIAAIYAQQGRWQLAKNQYLTALGVLKQQSNKSAFVARLCVQLSNVLLPQALNQPDSAKLYINQALDLQRKNNLTNKLGYTYRSLGDYYFQTGQLKRAVDTLQVAATLRQAQNDRRGVAQTCELLAKVYTKLTKFSIAAGQYQQALIALSDGFQQADYQQNPKLNQLRFRHDALPILKGKLSVLLLAYHQRHDISFLQAAYNTIILADELVNYLRASYQLEGSKLFLSEQAHELYGKAIETTWLLYQQTKQSPWLEKAFRFSERNRAVVLFETVKAAGGSKFGNVPTELIDQEKDLLQKITVYENLIAEESERKPNSKRINLLQINQLEATQQLQKLKEKFENNYADYFHYRYEAEPLSPKTIQENLAEGQAMLEYFVFNNHLFTFLITKKDFRLHQQKLPPNFNQIVQQYRKTLQSGEVSNFMKNARILYQILIQNADNQFVEKINRLIIVPDGLLHQIPFEPLLYRSVSTLTEKNIYLIERMAIGYAASATMRWQQVNHEHQSLHYIAFSPHYPVQDLPNNRLLVSALRKELKGESFLNESATKAHFLEQIGKPCGILHLSMHAEASENASLQSQLRFTDDSLSAREIYSLSIPTQLTLLDACETGVGTLWAGEGLMSLARAFRHAGSQTVVMSLWKLSSRPETIEITRLFVENLNQGLARDEALRQAKLTYLNRHRRNLALSHPQLWSALVLIGDTQPLSKSNTTTWVIGVFAVALTISLAYLFFLRKPAGLSKRFGHS